MGVISNRKYSFTIILLYPELLNPKAQTLQRKPQSTERLRQRLGQLCGSLGRGGRGAGFVWLGV